MLRVRLGRMVGIAGALLFAAGVPSAQAMGWLQSEGVYVGGGVGQEWVGSDFTKGIAIPDDMISDGGGSTPFPVTNSYREDSTDATQVVPALTVFAGHRWTLPNRLYVSGEIEGTLYHDARVTGFIPGTRTPGGTVPGQGAEPGITTLDVWPGAWALEKHWSIGVNLKLGYKPVAMEYLGPGRSLYLFAGVRYLDANVEAAFDNRPPAGNDLDAFCDPAPCALRGRTGIERDDRTAVPWLIGGGMEVGGQEHRLDFRAYYSMYEIDLNTVNASREVLLNHRFAIDEVGVYLGYVRFFGV